MAEISINEAYIIAFADELQNKIFTEQYIIDKVVKICEKSKDSILPSDHCYNRWNKDLEKKKWQPMFLYLGNKEYKHIGVNAQYTGKVICRPKGEKKEYFCGEWNDGNFHKYEKLIAVGEKSMLNKDILNKYVAEYKENFMDIRYGKDHNEIYKWEAVEHFKRNWNIDADDISEMLKQAFSKTFNLLTRANYFPVGMMAGFATKEPETVRKMFRELFDENRDLAKRVADFMLQANELHKRNPGGKSHFQTTNTISVYLWLKYPEKYYVYQWGIFDANLKILEGQYNIKKDGSPESMISGFKFYDEIRGELIKDNELLKLNIENGVVGYDDKTLNTLTVDIGFYIYEQNKKWEPSLKEYDPKISVEKWQELWNDKDVFDEKSKKLMEEMMLLKGEATCSQLAEYFLGDSKKFRSYNNAFMYLGRKVYEKVNCPLYEKDDEKDKNYWAVSCFYRRVDKSINDGVKGLFVFKLRDELRKALRNVGLQFGGIEGIVINKGQNIMSKYPKNLILYGPPGTGKTYNTVNYAISIIENKLLKDVVAENRAEVLNRYRQYIDAGLIEFCTFHQSFGYEEFIEGIKPVTENGNVVYKVQDGVFKAFCKEQGTLQPQNKVFIIDEINRGNISKIFAELITLIEESKRIGAEEEMRVRLPYSGDKFGVPNSVYLIGTMNTADRSIALLDTALRRRFKFIEMQPNTDLLKDINVEGVDVKAMLDMINRRIEVLYDREHTIGHSFFMSLNNESSIEDLAEIFEHNVIPLLKEYFYDDYEKIAAVLSDNLDEPNEFNFIKKENDDYAKIFNSDITMLTAYTFNMGALKNPEAYKKIYK